MQGYGRIGHGITLALYDSFTNPARGISSSMNGLESQARAMADTVNMAIGKMQQAFSGVVAGMAIASPFIIAIDRARQFEQQLSNIQSLGVLKKDMKDVEALAMEMGAKTKFSAFEAAQGIEELLKAGVDITAIKDKNGLSGALDLAVAGNLRLADAAEIASTALNAFRADAMNIRQAGDILAGAANASATDVTTLRLSLAAVSAVASGIGLNFKDTNTALAVFANNGLKGSDAGTSLKTMLMNLQPRTKEQIATFKELGLMTANGANAFFDASGNIKDMAGISGLLNQELKHLTPQQRSFALETMFGSDAVRAATILFKEGAQGINKMASEMTKFTSASVARERLNNLNGALEMLWGSIDTILIQVGQMFLPTLTRLTQGLNVVADAFQALVNTDIGRYAILASSAFVGFVVVFGTIIPFIQTTVSVMRILAVVAWHTAQAFAPYLAVGAVIIFAYKAFSDFKDVLAGSVQPAQGLLGFMQRLGAVMWSVGQVISSWDGKSFDLGGAEAQLQALGMLDIVKAISTYTVRAIEFVKGVGSGIYSVFAGVAGVFQYVVNAVQSFLQVFGVQNASLQKATSLAQGWINAGKVVGYVLGTVLVGATIALTASLGSMAIAMVAATWPVLAVVGAITAVVGAILYWDSITKWFSSAWSNAMKWVGNTVSWLVQYIKNDMTRDISKVFFYLAHSIPAWLGMAFRGALSLVSGLITQFIPWLISQWYNFMMWAQLNLPALLGMAVSTALSLAYSYFFEFMPQVVSLFLNLGGWLLQNVPYFFMSAFASAVILVVQLISEFIYSMGKFFYDLGTGIGTALWEGLKSVWNDILSWWNSSMQSIGLDMLKVEQQANAINNSGKTGIPNASGANPYGLSLLSIDPNTSTAEPNYNTEIARKNAEIKNYQFQRTNNANQVQNVTNNNAPEYLNVTFDMGNGDTLHKTISWQEALAQVRK